MTTRGFLSGLTRPLLGWRNADSDKAPTLRLRLPLTRLFPGDPERARAMYRGHFHLAETSFDAAPPSLFATPLPAAATAALLGLEWLRDFAAEPRALTSVMARRLLVLWDGAARPADALVEAKALLNLVVDGPPLFASAGQATMAELGGLVSHQLNRVLRQRRNGDGIQLWQGMALTHAIAVFDGLDHLRESASDLLARGLSAFILPDGGPASRQPRHLLDLLALLLPLRQAMFDARLQVPAPLHGALERMLPMLRLLCHGDGGLALFHGAGLETETVAKLLALDSTGGRPVTIAPHAGFARISHGASVLIADTAAGGPHHSALAVEFSDGAQRILSNCGSPLWGKQAWRRAATSSLAHNTLSMDAAPLACAAPTLENARAGSLITMAARHAGGLNHSRECFLAGSGHDLRVCDTLTGPDQAVTLRLHLHPAVKASSFHRGEALILMLPGRTVWEFEARGANLRLDESVSMSEAQGPRRSQQIILSARATPEGTTLRWALRKRLKPARAKTEANA